MRKALLYLGPLVVALILAAISLTQLGYRTETMVLDQWFSLRYRLFGSQPVDPRLVMVGVDEQSFQAAGKPLILWQRELAKLATAIRQGEPKALALDFLLAPKTEKLLDDDPILQRFEEEAFELGSQAFEDPPLFFIEVASLDVKFDKKSDGSDEDSRNSDGAISPPQVILTLLQDENGLFNNLAFANTPTDPDGLLRRFKPIYRTMNQKGEKKAMNLAFLLLEAATGEPVRVEDGLIQWGDVTAPPLFDESSLINFPGPTENDTGGGHDHTKSLTFPIYSAQKVRNPNFDASVFKDKIVLIAPTARSLDDQKVVPGDSSYHGGAVHLSIINMFLQDLFLSRPKALWFALPILFGLAGFRVGGSGRLGPVIGLLALTICVSFLTFCFAQIWLPTISTLVTLLLASMQGYLRRLFSVEKDRARVRSTFGRMVSPQVMNHVLNNYQELKNGERKEVTVLFSDINDFTPICEQHTPEEVIQMLSEYFSSMVDVIMKYDGYLKQYVGDEIMVIFGAPEDSDDHATRAVLTALEMRDVLATAKETSAGKPGFYDVKIGINTGSVVVGKVGPESRWEYAAVGDDVNLGARVMSVAKKLGMDIGVSASSKKRFDLETEEGRKISDKILWDSKGTQSFKGKISQMEVFGIGRE